MLHHARLAPWVLLVTLTLACGGQTSGGGSPADGGSAGQGGSAQAGQAGGGQGGMSGTSGQAGAAGQAGGVAGTSGVWACTPGFVRPCGQAGASSCTQRCLDDGSGWGTCACSPTEGGGGIGGQGDSGGPGAAPAVWSVTSRVVPPEGGESYSSISQLGSDGQGDLFLLGQARGKFEDGVLDTGDSSVTILRKLDPAGQTLWSLPCLGTWGVFEFALDAAGDLLVAGVYNGEEVDLGQGVVLPAGEASLFVASLSGADGSARWATPLLLPGSLLGGGSSVSVSPLTGEVVVATHISDPEPPPPFGTPNPRLATFHLDAQGKLLEIRQIGGNASQVVIRHKPGGSLVLGGTLQTGTAVFGTGGTPVALGDVQWFSHPFLAEITAGGANVFTRDFASAGWLDGLTLGPGGSVVASGTMSLPGADFGGGSLAAEADPFIAVYGADSSWLWDRSNFGGSTLAEMTISGVAVGATGEVSVVGVAAGAGDLGGGPFVRHAAFYARYAPGGALVAASMYDHAWFRAITLKPDGSPVVAGRYEPGADLGQGALTDQGWVIAQLAP